MKIFLLAAFCFITISTFGQTPKIDSLKKLIYTAPADEVRLKVILALCDEHESLQKDTLWHYALKARSLAAKLHDGVSQSWAKLAQASAYLRWNNADSAKALIEPEVLKYKADNAATRRLYFKLIQKEIDCNGEDNYYRDGSARVYSLMHLAEKYRDSVIIAESMNTLGAWDYDMNFVDRSTNWEYKAISYCSLHDPKFYPVLAGLYINLAGNYNWIRKPDSAEYFIEKSIKLCEQMQNLLFLSIAWEVRASTYKIKKDYARAEQAMFKCMELNRIIDGDEPQQGPLLILASIYRNAGNVDKAIKVLKDGLVADSLYKYRSPHSPKKQDSKDLQLVFYYQELARNYHLKGDLKNYGAMLEKVIAGKDAFNEANSSRAIAEMETKYEFQKNEATIARQRLAIIKERSLLYGSAIFVVLAGIIVWLVFKEIRRKQKLRMLQLQNEEKRLAAGAVADAQERERKRIAADLHDNLGAQLSFIKRNVNFIMDQPAGFSQQDERKYLNNVNDIAQNAIVDLRETIWVLNKDDVKIQEFADKLKSYLKQQLLDKEAIRWDFTENITGNWPLSSGEVMHLFRIVQEVVSNIIMHSGADMINILLQSGEPGSYHLEIYDNGKGFDAGSKPDGHYGLENIAQRANEIAAILTIESDTEKGTRIILIKRKNNSNELLGGMVDNDTFK